MLRLGLRSVMGAKLRLALSALAVVLGVAFVAGTFVLTDSIDRAFSGLLADASAGVDAYVNPATDEGQQGGPPGVDTTGGATLDEALVEQVLAVDGVEAATGQVEGVAQITYVDDDGETTVLGGQGPPQLGASFDETGATTLRAGAAPSGPGEVAVDVTSAERAGLAVGDTVTVLLPQTGPQEFTLAGTVGFGEEDNLLGATLALFDLPVAQGLFDKQGELDAVAIEAADDVDVTELVAALDAAVGSGDVEVVSAADQQQQDQQDIAQGLGFLNTVLLAFAGVALFVGAFIIVNTFSITVAQRTREFALLRAVGASRRQVRTLVTLEALAIGVVGGALGLGSGVLLAVGVQAAFRAFGIAIPDGGTIVAPRTIIASFTIAIVVTVAAALAPARRAAKVSPVEALRGTGTLDAARVGRARTAWGVVLTALGGVLLFLGLTGATGNGVAVVGGGVAALFVGVALLAPWLARPVVALVGVVLGRSVVARLARANAARNPSRTASTASALMIGVALVTFVSILAASITASVGGLFEDQFGADLAVQSQGGFGTIPGAFTTAAEDVEGVDSVAAVPLAAGADADGGDVLVAGVPTATIDDHLRLGAEPGALGALADGGLLLGADLAATLEVGTGDPVTLSLPAAADVLLEVVGTFENTGLLGTPYVVALPTYRELVGGAGAPSFVSIVFDDAADRDEVRAGVEALAEEYPGVGVQDVGEVLAQTQDQVDQLLNVIIGLLALALLIAVIGIVNTLALSVLERTREIGLLRAVGMERGQVRAAVRREAVLVSVFGALLGIVLGTLFGWALVTSLAEEGIGELVLPGGRLVVYVLGAAVAGVVAAVLPARRAARLDVLRAVTTE